MFDLTFLISYLCRGIVKSYVVKFTPKDQSAINTSISFIIKVKLDQLRQNRVFGFLLPELDFKSQAFCLEYPVISCSLIRTV